MTTDTDALRNQIRQFLAEALPPDWYTRRIDSDAPEDFQLARKFSKLFAEVGSLINHWPPEWGGARLSAEQMQLLKDEMGEVRPPRDISMDHAVAWVGPVLIQHGTKELQEFFLPKIQRAELGFCTLFSEPGAGSDLAGLQTRAVRDGDEFVINGSKVWTSGGFNADYGWLGCRTDPDAPKHRGISLIVIDMKQPGVTVRPLVSLHGEHHFNEIFLEDVRAPATNLVGELNDGWKLVMQSLNMERSGGGMGGGGRQAEPVEIVKQRIEEYRACGRYGAPASEAVTIRGALADETIDLTVARLLGQRIGELRKRGEPVTYEASIAKVFSSERAQVHARAHLSMLGLHGQLLRHSPHAPADGNAPHHYMGSLGGTVAGGTSEIQRNTIATRGLALPRG